VRRITFPSAPEFPAGQARGNSALRAVASLRLRSVGEDMQDHFVARISYPILSPQTAGGELLLGRFRKNW
jgi:hypothetical protein